MKIQMIILSALLISGFSANAQRNCLSQHLTEAIELNEVRREIYAEMTQGKSKKVSNQLIRYEKFIHSILPLTGIEKAAKELQDQGIPMLCEDFHAGLNPHAPVLQKDRPQLSDFKAFNHKKAKQLLAEQIEAGNLSGVYTQAVALIESASDEMRFHCMIRHVLESIARVAKQGIKYDEMAKEKGLTEKPSELTLKILKYEIKTLYGSAQLDEKAALFQAQGVPILCHDLPVIEY